MGAKIIKTIPIDKYTSLILQSYNGKVSACIAQRGYGDNEGKDYMKFCLVKEKGKITRDEIPDGFKLVPMSFGYADEDEVTDLMNAFGQGYGALKNIGKNMEEEAPPF